MTVPQTNGLEALRDEMSSSCRNFRTTTNLGEEVNGGPQSSCSPQPPWGPLCFRPGATRLRLASILPTSLVTKKRKSPRQGQTRGLQSAPWPLSHGFIFSPEKWEMPKFGFPKQKVCGFLK